MGPRSLPGSAPVTVRVSAPPGKTWTHQTRPSIPTHLPHSKPPLSTPPNVARLIPNPPLECFRFDPLSFRGQVPRVFLNSNTKGTKEQSFRAGKIHVGKIKSDAPENLRSFLPCYFVVNPSCFLRSLRSSNRRIKEGNIATTFLPSSILPPRLFQNGGAKEARTPDLLNAIQALYQLSYDPIHETERHANGFVPQVKPFCLGKWIEPMRQNP